MTDTDIWDTHPAELARRIVELERKLAEVILKLDELQKWQASHGKLHQYNRVMGRYG